MPTARDGALDLAKRGLKVFRTNATTCRPMAQRFWEYATADRATVERLFTAPDGESVEDNVAVSTGEGIVVLDFDVKDQQPGLKTFAELVKEGLPTETLTVRTPSGGLHLYFHVDRDLQCKNRIKYWPGVDIRGEHGYVNAPGTTKVDGKGYEIVKDCNIAPLPEPFRRSLAAGRTVAARVEETSEYEDEWSIAQAVEYLSTCEQDTTIGDRHNALVRVGHRLYDYGVTRSTAIELVNEHWPPALELDDEDRVDYQLDNLATSRCNAGKPWGSLHPRKRPSAYLELQRVTLARPEDEGPRQNAARDGLGVFSLAELAGEPVPKRKWLVADYVPDRAVTMLSGDGGVGKSLLALQFGAAVCLGRDWLGMAVVGAGPVIYASAEDDADEIHIRSTDIARGEGIGLERLEAFHVVPLAGMDAVLGSPDAGGIVRPTKLWTKFEKLCERIQPRMVILDTLADVFGGDENVRTQARQFVGLLRGLAMRLECAVLLLAHPSLSGMASGEGTSGSTGWNNSVRGRLYLTRPKVGAIARDANTRVLTTKKENYSGGYGEEKLLRWDAGRFVLIENRVAIEQDVEALFLGLLEDFAKQGRSVYPSTGRGYACAAFTKTTKGSGTTAAQFHEAMERLLERGEIKIAKRGPPSKAVSVLVKNVAEADALAEFL